MCKPHKSNAFKGTQGARTVQDRRNDHRGLRADG